MSESNPPPPSDPDRPDAEGSSEQESTAAAQEASSPPPPPSGSAAPPPPPPAGTAGGGSRAEPGSSAVSPNRNMMIVLAYLGPLALVSLLAEPDDPEVQWHSKHGLVFLGAEILFIMVVFVLSAASGGLLGCVLVPLMFLAGLVFLGVHVAAIVQGINGKRLLIPGLSPLVEKF